MASSVGGAQRVLPVSPVAERALDRGSSGGIVATHARYRRSAATRDSGGHLLGAISVSGGAQPGASASASKGTGAGTGALAAAAALAASNAAPRWWALLYVSISGESEHTRMVCSNDEACILRDAELARRRATVPRRDAKTDNHSSERNEEAKAGGGSSSSSIAGWDLAMAIGKFSDQRSAANFCHVWAERCRGAISRFSRGETIANQMGLTAYGDFCVITRDPHAYDFITIVDQQQQQQQSISTSSASKEALRSVKSGDGNDDEDNDNADA